MTETLYILCVDDEKSILDTYIEILTPRKVRSSRRRQPSNQHSDLRNTYEVLSASSGEEAIDVVKDLHEEGKRFSVGFFDMRMPGLDGMETMREILQIDSKIQCVVVTANTDRHPNEIVSIFHDPSQFVYLNKPFSETEISQMALSLASLWTEKKKTERMLESMVKAASKAIDARDPTTSGHSSRVAKMTVELARATDRIDSGDLKDETFDRYQLETIRYAALLHDFGKIGVREHVLVKANKLYPWDYERIQLRLELQKAVGEISEADKKNYLEIIDTANSPTVLLQEPALALKKIHEAGIISKQEYQYLSIPRGSLTNGEREEIENHVTQTYDFLKQIDWTQDFSRVPEIAKAHHEKVDGSGYPDGITDIPIEARMMTVADIYDALTASDRPYKRAISTDRALDILQFEVNSNKVDAELYQIFVEAKIYEHIAPKK